MNINEAKKAFSKYQFNNFTIYRAYENPYEYDKRKWCVQYGEDYSGNKTFIEVNDETKYYESIDAAMSDIRKIVKAPDNTNLKATVCIERDYICIEHEDIMSRKKFPDNIVD